jgi:predicted nuclease of predicted toxin-antitoxin system
MKFLIDEDLPRSTGDRIRRYGYEAVDVRDVVLRGAKDAQIARYAQENQLCLLTGDFDFADIRNYPPSIYSGIVVLELPKDPSVSSILDLLEEFLKQNELIKKIPGQLAIVEPGRIRFRKR